LVVALSVVWKLGFNPVVYFPQGHALLRRAADCHSDQLHVRIWRSFLMLITLTLSNHTTYTHSPLIVYRNRAKSVWCSDQFELLLLISQMTAQPSVEDTGTFHSRLICGGVLSVG